MDNNASAGSNLKMMTTLGLFGKMLNIASIYGLNHPALKNPLKETYRTLEALLKTEKKVTLGLFNQTLTVNDKMVAEYTVHLRALERRFVALNIPHLILRRGITIDELRQLTELLCTGGSQTAQSLKDKLDQAGLSHVKAEQVDYVAQHEGERLVGKNEEPGEGTGGDRAADSQDDAEGDTPKHKKEGNEAPAPIRIDQIMAFLKGDIPAEDAPEKDMQKLLSDPEKLGQLIMESVSIRQSVQSLDAGESLADIVIGCLRRTYEGLNSQKKHRSARGKASLNKAMLLLEKTVVDKIRDSVGGDHPEIDAQIRSALREAEERRHVEILAARYAEQRKKTTKAETEIIRCAQEHGEEKTRAALEEFGVTEQDWTRLMVQTRPAETAGGPAGGASAIDMNALAIVLDKLETIMDLENIPPEIVKSAVEEVRTNIEHATSAVEKQIAKIEKQMSRQEAGSRQTSDPEEQREQRADTLLEISHLALKLFQPLTVITASVEAALKQTDRPELQTELLELAHESGEIMKKLMKRMSRLTGYPSIEEADKNSLLYC